MINKESVINVCNFQSEQSEEAKQQVLLRENGENVVLCDGKQEKEAAFEDAGQGRSSTAGFRVGETAVFSPLKRSLRA